jgi:hypothetical protein
MTLRLTYVQPADLASHLLLNFVDLAIHIILTTFLPCPTDLMTLRLTDVKSADLASHPFPLKPVDLASHLLLNTVDLASHLLLTTF